MTNELTIVDHNSNYMDVAKYEQLGRVANMFAKSDLIPAVYKDKPHNCFIAIQLAMRLNIDPFLAFQNLYVVQGNPAMSAKLCISLANRSGIFDGNIVFEEKGIGKDLTVTASAKLKSNGIVVTKTMTFAQAAAAGWTNKPVWQSQPGQMLAYRTATQLIRLYAPDAILGMTTVEEWEDVTETVQKRSYNKKTSPLNDMQLNEKPEEKIEQNTTTEKVEVISPVTNQTFTLEDKQPEPEKKRNPISDILNKIEEQK